MGELGELLELLHTGGAGGRTVRAVVRTWRHRERSEDASRAAAEAEGATVVGYAELAGPDDDGDDAPAPEADETVARVWLAPPDRAREEVQRGRGETSVAVRTGARWWHYDPEWGATSNEGDEDVETNVADDVAPLFAPAWLLGTLVLEAAGTSEVNGRPARLALARPRPVRPRLHDEAWELYAIGAGAEEWELAVDAEHGVLLRAEARRGGAPFHRIEVIELAIGEEIPAEVFTFEPPPGVEVRAIDEPARFEHHLALDELARLAPFTVFVPDRLEPGWERQAMFFPGGERPPSPPTAFLHLTSPDGHWQLTLQQRPAAAGDDDDERHDALDVPDAWETVRRGDVTVEVREPTERWASTLVRTEIGGTRIRISSDDLPAERLVDLAGRLVPAPSEPPPL